MDMSLGGGTPVSYSTPGRISGRRARRASGERRTVSSGERGGVPLRIGVPPEFVMIEVTGS